jgi:hypothetical protein
MSAKKTLPDSPSQSKTVPERIVELSGAQWAGVQETDSGPLVLFTCPITGSTLALPEESLSVAGVLASLESTREKFAVIS